eukprot:TRINITY_DN7223_c0_g1_i2.p2 TRINITY_DN7223_c0_g1~~TRINITY_DN7223_c0_g1_i2.p2  ORF type:complete len:168 (+),score=22.55 TRINITY_DN7223_c0_g1_i2:1213-1716(+)
MESMCVCLDVIKFGSELRSYSYKSTLTFNNTNMLQASFSISSQQFKSQSLASAFQKQCLRRARKTRLQSCRVLAHKVEIEHEGQIHTLDVGDGQTILEVALDQGLELPHDCKMGVAGNVDQSASIMSEDVAEKGYALLCVAEPLGDCKIKTVPEDELLDEQLVTSSM